MKNINEMQLEEGLVESLRWTSVYDEPDDLHHPGSQWFKLAVDLEGKFWKLEVKFVGKDWETIDI